MSGEQQQQGPSLDQVMLLARDNLDAVADVIKRLYNAIAKLTKENEELKKQIPKA